MGLCPLLTESRPAGHPAVAALLAEDDHAADHGLAGVGGSVVRFRAAAQCGGGHASLLWRDCGVIVQVRAGPAGAGLDAIRFFSGLGRLGTDPAQCRARPLFAAPYRLRNQEDSDATTFQSA